MIMKFISSKRMYVSKILKITQVFVMKGKHTTLKAFTFIEMLLAFFVFSLTITLIPPLIASINQLNNQMNSNILVDYEFFAHDISRELNSVPIDKIDVQDHQIKAKQQNKEVTYVIRGGKIYKNINSKGNVTLLQNIEEIHVSKKEHLWIKMEVILRENNQRYKKTLFL